jgi:alpha-galactosidase
MWRSAGDINNRWLSIMNILDRHVDTLRFAGPNFWPDPDMLETGAPTRAANGAKQAPMTITEQRSQFSLWAIMNAPLFISADLRNIDEPAKAILLNRDVIDVNQDPLAIAGRRIRKDGDAEVFAKRVKDGEAVVLLNRGEKPMEIRVTAAELGLDAGAAWEARNLWSGKTERATGGSMSADVGVTMWRVGRP